MNTEQVPTNSDVGRNTSLIAGKSSIKTTGSQISWRNLPRLRAPWKNPILISALGETHIHVVQPEHGVDKWVIVNNEDVDKLKFPLRIQGEYAYNRGENCPVAHTVLGVKPDSTLRKVVDHENGNHLDNRKQNLRVVPFRVNVINKGHYSLNHTGIIGLSKGTFKVKHSDNIYYRYVATITDPRFPIDPKTQKGKRYTRAVSYGKNRTEEEAKKIALQWLRKKQAEVYSGTVVEKGSTTIPGMGVDASASK